MEIPNLPTDSAYKFLAVGSIVIAVVTAYLMFNLMSMSVDRTKDLSEDIAKVAAALEQSKSDSEAASVRATIISFEARQLSIDLPLYAAFVLAVVFIAALAAFAFAIKRWLKLQFLADIVAAYEIREIAQKSGVTIDVIVPKNIRF